ncbi:unnamed protein product [Arctogadus glacialis]
MRQGGGRRFTLQRARLTPELGQQEEEVEVEVEEVELELGQQELGQQEEEVEEEEEEEEVVELWQQEEEEVKLEDVGGKVKVVEELGQQEKVEEEGKKEVKVNEEVKEDVKVEEEKEDIKVEEEKVEEVEVEEEVGGVKQVRFSRRPGPGSLCSRRCVEPLHRVRAEERREQTIRRLVELNSAWQQRHPMQDEWPGVANGDLTGAKRVLEEDLEEDSCLAERPFIALR